MTEHHNIDREFGIKLSNGRVIYYMAASATLGFDGRGYPPLDTLLSLKLPGLKPLLDPGLFTIVTKTLTLHERKGNYRWYYPPSCIRLIRSGSVNAVGLTNPGIRWWLREIVPRIDTSDIVVSIFSDRSENEKYLEELGEMAMQLDKLDLTAIEINASCPNTGGDCLKQSAQRIIDGCLTVHAMTRHPVIFKLSVAHPLEEIAALLNQLPPKTVEAISINSVPWSAVFPDRKSPLKKYGDGGVSGKPAQKFTWKAVEKLVGLTDIPIIGPSVWDYEDIETLMRIGASAISFGAAFFIPGRPTRYVRRHMKEKRITGRK
jgi:dihydroorotate dehydrogenase